MLKKTLILIEATKYFDLCQFKRQHSNRNCFQLWKSNSRDDVTELVTDHYKSPVSIHFQTRVVLAL